MRDKYPLDGDNAAFHQKLRTVRSGGIFKVTNMTYKTTELEFIRSDWLNQG